MEVRGGTGLGLWLWLWWMGRRWGPEEGWRLWFVVLVGRGGSWGMAVGGGTDGVVVCGFLRMGLGREWFLVSNGREVMDKARRNDGWRLDGLLVVSAVVLTKLW